MQGELDYEPGRAARLTSLGFDSLRKLHLRRLAAQSLLQSSASLPALLMVTAMDRTDLPPPPPPVQGSQGGVAEVVERRF